MFEDEKKEGVGLSYFLKEKGRLQMGNKSTANKGAAIEMCKAKNPAWQKPRLSEGNITGPLAKAQRPHTCPPVTTSLCAPTRQERDGEGQSNSNLWHAVFQELCEAACRYSHLSLPITLRHTKIIISPSN